jgi:hypothetical protein
VPEYVALPDPSEPVVARQAGALDDVSRMRHDSERVELEKVLPHLLAEERPRDIQERRNARVAHEMRHVRVPTPHTTEPSTRPSPHHHRSANTKEKKKKELGERERTHVRATSSANASVLHTDAKSSTCIATTRFAPKAATRSASPGAAVLNRATSRSNNSSNSARAASARCRLRHAMMSVAPAQGYSSSRPGSRSEPPVLGKRGKTERASSGVFCARP